uniref:alpha-glucosidase C-terminal domain-containing protein n=1 Tax=Streptomyces sp. GbtcB7 TaxID=2824752 RepID=UPI001C302D45
AAPVLCVHTSSRFPPPPGLPLRASTGRRPVDLSGGVRFPAIGVLPYLLTLVGHAFYWFRLRKVAFCPQVSHQNPVGGVVS